MSLIDLDWEIDSYITSSLQATSSLPSSNANSSFSLLLLSRYKLWKQSQLSLLSFNAQDYKSVNNDAFLTQFHKHQHNGSKVFWLNKENQYLRFEKLCEFFDLSGASVIDIGCGYGDLLNYFSVSNINYETYLGVDINARIVKQAKKQHPESDFRVIDILSERNKLSVFDYGFASGIFALVVDDWEEYIKSMLKSLYSLVLKGFAVNFENGKGKSPNPKFLYLNQSQITEILRSLPFTNINLQTTDDFITLSVLKGN